MSSTQLVGKRCVLVAVLLAAVQLSAAVESEKCQALGFTGPVCSDCDTLASYVKDEGALENSCAWHALIMLQSRLYAPVYTARFDRALSGNR
jgi:hypothetical protein